MEKLLFSLLLIVVGLVVAWVNENKVETRRGELICFWTMSALFAGWFWLIFM